MQLKFEGQTHSIDANTLINVLTHYQTVVQEANKTYGGGSRDVSIKINAIEKGSFVIDISVVQNVIEQLFSKDSVEYVAAISAIVGGVYACYKRFKGKPVANKEEVVNNGVVITGDINMTLNVYNQPVVREAISKSIETSAGDANVEGFSVSGTNCGNVEFERKDFKDYIYDDFDNEGNIPDERIKEEETTLVIVGLNFERGSRWQFMYNGFKISMIVKDDALMKKIDEGERFGKGDAIRVKLRIVQRFNKDYKAYENKNYKIVEFISHIIPQQPDSLI